MQDINIEEIKQYNNNLKQQRDKAATLKAQIEYATNELNTLCKELSAELGKEVTVDNVAQIYDEEVTKIQSTLTAGNAVLAKIAGEEAKVQQPTTPVQPVYTGAVQTAPITQAPVEQSVPVQPNPLAYGNSATQATNPFIQQATPVQNTPVAQAPTFNGTTLPPMFNI